MVSAQGDMVSAQGDMVSAQGDMIRHEIDSRPFAHLCDECWRGSLASTMGQHAMPVHDWTHVDAGILHAFHHSWIEEIARALNRGLLPPDYYALPEQHAAGFGQSGEPERY
jgi:hypothetical protein